LFIYKTINERQLSNIAVLCDETPGSLVGRTAVSD